MQVKEFLSKINAVPHISGYEGALLDIITEEFSPHAEISTDKFGNIIAYKKGSDENGPRVMISAHMDEIGMMVKAICDGGFVQFSPVGGIDARNCLAQEVTIHGREPIFGVIGIKPPHLTSNNERNRGLMLHDMTIDTGFSKEVLETKIRVGDLITFNGDIIELQGGQISGKALDDSAGVAAMGVAMEHLKYFNHKANVYFVSSAQEEVGLRGAQTATYNIKPDIGIAIDVGFGRANGLAEYESVELGKGPGITMGPNITRKLFESLKKTANNAGIKYQVELATHGTGTDANAIQIGLGDGVITGLLTIPLKYMHSTVETIALSDVEACGKLIAQYIMSLNDEEVTP